MPALFRPGAIRAMVDPSGDGGGIDLPMSYGRDRYRLLWGHTLMKQQLRIQLAQLR